MTKKTYVVEIETDENGYWDGKITDQSGGEVPSKEIFEVQRCLACMGELAAHAEASTNIKPGHMYWYRGKRGVGYVIVKRIEQRKVFVMESDKNGITHPKSSVFEFYDAQRLKLAKTQPHHNACT